MDLLKLLESQLTKKAVGILTLGKRKLFREVFFEGESVYLVGQQFSGKLPAANLGKLGIPGNRLSRERFEQIIETADLKHVPLAQTLREANLIQEEEAADLVRDQILEDLLDLLYRSSASFHFQETRVPEYLFNCESVTSRTPLPLTTVIETLRVRLQRNAEHELVIPSGDEVFVFTDRGQTVRHGGTEDLAMVLTLELVDGLRTLAAIVADVRIHEYHAFCAIREALEKGYIKKTLLPELRGISTQNLSQSEVRKYLPYFENAVKYGVDELAARDRLAVLYEKLGSVDQAVAEYVTIGDSFRNVQKPAKAIKAYLRALALKPGDAAIKTRASDIYLEAADQETEAGNAAQATSFLECALRLFPTDERIFNRLLDLFLRDGKVREISNLCDWAIEQARASKDLEPAVAVCRRVVEALPRIAVLRKKLVNLYLDMSRAEEARSELRRLGEQYLADGDRAKAVEIVDKLRKLGERPSVLTKLEATVGEPKIPRVERRRSPRLSRYAVVAVVLLVLGYQGAGLAVWDGIRARTAMALAPETASPNRLIAGSEELRHREISDRCGRFLRWFPFHVLRYKVSALFDKSKERADELRRRREALADEALQDVREALADGAESRASRILALLVELRPGDPRRVEAEQLATRAAALRASAKEMLEGARKLEQDAEQRHDASSWRKANEAYCDLLDRFPDSSVTRDVDVPVWVDSLPRGASVHEVLKPGDARFLGVTPIVYRMAPGDLPILELSANGYGKYSGRLSNPREAAVTFQLARLPEWSERRRGTIEHAPAFSGPLVWYGTSDGAVACLAADPDGSGKHSLAWSWQSPDGGLHRILAPPVVTPHGVCTVWSDSQIRRFSQRRGAGARDDAPPEMDRVVLKGLPCTRLVHVAGASALVVGTITNRLEIREESTLELRGQVALDESEGRPTALVEAAGALWAGTQKGAIFRVDPVRRTAEKLREGTGEAIVDIHAAGEILLAETDPVGLLILRGGEALRDGWKAFDPGRVRSVALLPDAGKLAVLQEGTLHLVALDTGRVAAVEVGAWAASVERLGDAVGVFDGARTEVLVVDTRTDTPLWVVRATSRLAAAWSDAARVAVGVAPAEGASDKLGTLLLFRR